VAAGGTPIRRYVLALTPAGAGIEAAVAAASVPPLGGGTGSHGSEAAHAFTVAGMCVVSVETGQPRKRRNDSATGRNNVATAGRYRYRGLHDALTQHYRTRIVAAAAVRDAGHAPEQGGFRVGRESRQTEAAKGEQDPGSGFLLS